ncbi:hypothetical protein ACF0H5_010479 [Mactra antiquata]
MASANSNTEEHYKSESGQMVVAAIDFGTTYSGYAYSLTHEYEKDPTKVFAQVKWHSGAAQLISLKTPSILLLNPDKSFKSFGYDAENDYADLAIDNKHTDYYFFRHFKMLLYQSKILQRDMLVSDDNGKEMKAINVFKICIKFLHDHMLENVRHKFSGVNDTDIRWVLTVPAIWSDSSKQFMREAAQMAGIPKERLMIALEPEAASLYCMHLPLDKMVVEGNKSKESSRVSPFQKGMKYMIVDVGGGTVDITVHEVIDRSQLKELDFPSGGASGGTLVDKAFRDFLDDLVGKDVMKKFAKDCKEDYVLFLREFETKKRMINVEKKGRESMKLPITLTDLYKEKKGNTLKDDVEKVREFKEKVLISGDKIRIDTEIMRSWFNNCCEQIVFEVSKLLSKPKCKDVQTILLVGGFSESPMLQNAMRTNFSDRQLIIPEDAGLVVLKGAVIFGHNPVTIKSRIAKCSYGVRVYRDFREGVHPNSKKIKVGNVYKCRDVFACHVRKGQELVVGEAQHHQRYTPLERQQISLDFDIYTSTEENPMFVTDPSCDFVGKLEVAVPNMSGGNERGVWIQMIFGGTEIVVEAKEEKTGRISKATFNFLQDSCQGGSDSL